jgi:hypothetical protein
MSTVILDDAMKARLNGMNHHMEFRDTDGKLLGHFLTVSDYEAYKRLAIAEAKMEFDRQEAEEAANGIIRKWDGKSGKTTAEAIAHVKRLAEQIVTGQ